MRIVAAIAAVVALVIGAGLLVFHPSRPLYMQQRPVEVVVDDGVTLRGTISKPRWSRKPYPGVVLVHGSGPLTREHLTGDVRSLVQHGFVVLAYDKRGAGASSGEYLRQSRYPAETLLRRLAADAGAAFDQLAADPDVDSSRLGFFGASQAGWIIPPSCRTHPPPATIQRHFIGPGSFHRSRAVLQRLDWRWDASAASFRSG